MEEGKYSTIFESGGAESGAACKENGGYASRAPQKERFLIKFNTKSFDFWSGVGWPQDGTQNAGNKRMRPQQT